MRQSEWERKHKLKISIFHLKCVLCVYELGGVFNHAHQYMKIQQHQQLLCVRRLTKRIRQIALDLRAFCRCCWLLPLLLLCVCVCCCIRNVSFPLCCCCFITQIASCVFLFQFKCVAPVLFNAFSLPPLSRRVFFSFGSNIHSTKC